MRRMSSRSRARLQILYRCMTSNRYTYQFVRLLHRKILLLKIALSDNSDHATSTQHGNCEYLLLDDILIST